MKIPDITPEMLQKIKDKKVEELTVDEFMQVIKYALWKA